MVVVSVAGEMWTPVLCPDDALGRTERREQRGQQPSVVHLMNHVARRTGGRFP